MVIHLVKPPISSLRCSQPANNLQPKPDESSPYPAILFPTVPFSVLHSIPHLFCHSTVTHHVTMLLLGFFFVKKVHIKLFSIVQSGELTTNVNAIREHQNITTGRLTLLIRRSFTSSICKTYQ